MKRLLMENTTRTSGDYDGSLQADENDANLWFAIFYNYEIPVADAGDDQTVYTGETVNFSGLFRQHQKEQP